MKTLQSDGMEDKWSQVIYDLPTINEILDAEEMIYCASEFVTMQHFPSKKTWIVTSWGKFSINTKFCSKSTEFYFINIFRSWLFDRSPKSGATGK